MSVKESLAKVVGRLGEEQQKELLLFAEYLAARDDCERWKEAGYTQFAHAYAPDEPEYSMSDIRDARKP